MEFGWCGSLPVFLLGFCWAFWKPTTQPRNSVAGKMPGLGDMNFGDMGGDEYDSDDEDELEWDSWEDSSRIHVDSWGIHGENPVVIGDCCAVGFFFHPWTL